MFDSSVPIFVSDVADKVSAVLPPSAVEAIASFSNGFINPTVSNIVLPKSQSTEICEQLAKTGCKDNTCDAWKLNNCK